MKGIAHFISGVAVATFFPDAVQQAADGSLILVLGGLFGLLPDTLDFRFTRFIEHHDDEIDPGPQIARQDSQQDSWPQVMAERVAAAIRAAHETGQPKTVKLHTVRLSADQWRAYSVRFRSAANVVAVRVGPIVSTSGVPLPGSAPELHTEGRARIGVPIAPTYNDKIHIDVFSGPSFRFERHPPIPTHAKNLDIVEGRVHITFLPWHRRWTHSLVLATAIGLGIGLLLGPTAGLISGLGYAAHILQDQLGYMGSNLFWPLTQRRANGLRLLHSGDALPNFLTVWLAVALILFNLDRYSARPRLAPLPYLLVLVVLPSLVVSAVYWRGRRHTTKTGPETPIEALRQEEILAETEEIEL
jgi:membrane-bound metal-dependent hydrolase YbcI (DUF457 family)